VIMDYGESTQQGTTTRNMIKREREATIQAIKEASRRTLTRNKVREFEEELYKANKIIRRLNHSFVCNNSPLY